MTPASYRMGFYVLAVALAGSLTVHATNLKRTTAREAESPSAPAAPSSSVHSTSSPSATPAAFRDAEIDPATCAARLSECRAETWSVVAKAIRADAEERKPGVSPHRGPSAEPPEPTGPEDQKRVRCDVAEQQAREHWVNQKSNILASVKDIGTERWVATETKKGLDGLEKSLGIDPGERARLAREYTALWAKDGPLFQAALAKDPTDWAGLMDIVRAFWRDEDAMIERVLGPHGRDEYRATELRSRTAIVAILAALADRPFDDSLAW